MKYAALFLLASTTEAARIMKSGVNMPGMYSPPVPSAMNALAQTESQFVHNADSDALENQSLGEDLLSIAEYFGIDGKTTWMFSGNPQKYDLWEFLTLLETNQDDLGTQLTSSNDEIKGHVTAEANTLSTATNSRFDATDASIASFSSNVNSLFAAKNAFDTTVANEVIDRLRFITDRVKLLEEAIGAGYIEGSETVYSGATVSNALLGR